jgi:hypothetical protein
MGLWYNGLGYDSGYGAVIWWTGVRQWLWECDMMDWGTAVVMGLRYDGLGYGSGYGAAIWWTGVRQRLWGCDMMDWDTVVMGLWCDWLGYGGLGIQQWHWCLGSCMTVSFGFWYNSAVSRVWNTRVFNESEHGYYYAIETSESVCHCKMLVFIWTCAHHSSILAILTFVYNSVGMGVAWQTWMILLAPINC